jgi:hypothetical protein
MRKTLIFSLLFVAISQPAISTTEATQTTEAPQTSQAEALTPDEQGLVIAKERYKRFKGYGDYQMSMTMTMFNKKGASSTYKLRSKGLEVENDGDKSILVFDNPRDQKGIALLAYTHRVGPDDQMMYLPAIKRVKRIAANNKSGPFMGSEFAYEDLSSKEVEKAQYRYLRDEVKDGVDSLHHAILCCTFLAPVFRSLAHNI